MVDGFQGRAPGQDRGIGQLHRQRRRGTGDPKPALLQQGVRMCRLADGRCRVVKLE